MEDGEEVDENGNNEVCKHRIEHNRKRKECCGMCTKENGKDKSGTKKKQSEDKDGKKKTESIFERAACIMKKNEWKHNHHQKLKEKILQLLYSQMGLGLESIKDAQKE